MLYYTDYTTYTQFIKDFYRKIGHLSTFKQVYKGFSFIFFWKLSSKSDHFYIDKDGESPFQKRSKNISNNFMRNDFGDIMPAGWVGKHIYERLLQKNTFFWVFQLYISGISRLIFAKNDRKIWPFLYRQRRRKNLLKNVKNFVTPFLHHVFGAIWT